MIRVFKPWISIADLITVMKALIKKEISGASSYVKKFENEFSSQHNNLWYSKVDISWFRIFSFKKFEP